MVLLRFLSIGVDIGLHRNQWTTEFNGIKRKSGLNEYGVCRTRNPWICGSSSFANGSAAFDQLWRYVELVFLQLERLGGRCAREETPIPDNAVEINVWNLKSNQTLKPALVLCLIWLACFFHFDTLGGYWTISDHLEAQKTRQRASGLDVDRFWLFPGPFSF